MAPNFGLPTPWRVLSSPSRLTDFVCCNRWVAFVAWFFFQFNFAYIPLPFPAVSSPTSLSQSLVLCHSLSVFAFFFPCVRSPVVWFGSSFLSSPRAFSPIKGKKFFFHSPSVLFALLVSSFSSFIRLALEVFSDALDVQLRRRVRDGDPENLNAAVSRALVACLTNMARLIGAPVFRIPIPRHSAPLVMAQQRQFTSHRRWPSMRRRRWSILLLSLFLLLLLLPLPPLPLPPSLPGLRLCWWGKESCAPSQLDASVPVIVHKFGLYVSGTLCTDCENQSVFLPHVMWDMGLASPLWKRRCCLGSDCVAMNSFS